MAGGYWKVARGVPASAAAEFAESLKKRMGNPEAGPLVVREGVEWIPFEQPAPIHIHSAWPDAVCRYCASANLHTSNHCEKCGAPLTR